MIDNIRTRQFRSRIPLFSSQINQDVRDDVKSLKNFVDEINKSKKRKATTSHLR